MSPVHARSRPHRNSKAPRCNEVSKKNDVSDFCLNDNKKLSTTDDYLSSIAPYWEVANDDNVLNSDYYFESNGSINNYYC